MSARELTYLTVGIRTRRGVYFTVNVLTIAFLGALAMMGAQALAPPLVVGQLSLAVISTCVLTIRVLTHLGHLEEGRDSPDATMRFLFNLSLALPAISAIYVLAALQLAR